MAHRLALGQPRKKGRAGRSPSSEPRPVSPRRRSGPGLAGVADPRAERLDRLRQGPEHPDGSGLATSPLFRRRAARRLREQELRPDPGPVFLPDVRGDFREPAGLHSFLDQRPSVHRHHGVVLLGALSRRLKTTEGGRDPCPWLSGYTVTPRIRDPSARPPIRSYARIPLCSGPVPVVRLTAKERILIHLADY